MSDRALFQVPSGSAATKSQAQTKGLHIADLEDDLDLDHMRENEGEAANYGVYYDDTSYDYMQHLREIGGGSGEAHFVDAAPIKVQREGKGKARILKLEEALRESTIEDRRSEIDGGVSLTDRPSTILYSTKTKTYQDQQDVPDEIAGFQPDMDPRLREVLEALDDEAYVDDTDEEDVFGTLTQGGQGDLPDLDESKATFEDEEGWESDVTEKPAVREKFMLSSDTADNLTSDTSPEATSSSDEGAAKASAEDGDWLRDFAKSKGAAMKTLDPKIGATVATPSNAQAAAPSLYTLGGTPLRQKRRKGAITNPSAYSMTSSSLARTDGQQLLDARFEKIEAMYALEEANEFDDDRDGGMSVASGLSRRSRISTVSTSSFANGDVRSDLDGMMDDFLGGWNKGHPGGGKRNGAKGKRGKNGNELLGMRMLDEIRGDLGPARVFGTQNA